MTQLEEKVYKAIRNIPDFPIPGVQFKDITPIFLDHHLCQDLAQFFADKSRGKVDVVCGVESRGFLLGSMIAQILQLPFVLIRKAGKLPGETIQMDYDLEYGSSTIEIHKGFISPGQRVLIHDDLLATGGTAAAAAALIEKCDAQATQFSFIIELDFLHGRKVLSPYQSEIITAVHY